jgi:hypothetical protein
MSSSSQENSLDQNKKDEKDKKNIQISIDPQIAKGTYSNLMINNFSSDEFILDFALLQPTIPAATINSRVILTPKNAKKLMMLLQENIKKYESKVGPINLDSSPGSISMSFN